MQLPDVLQLIQFVCPICPVIRDNKIEMSTGARAPSDLGFGKRHGDFFSRGESTGPASTRTLSLFLT